MRRRGIEVKDACLAGRFLLELLGAGLEGGRFVGLSGSGDGGDIVGVEVVFELLEFDLVLVSEAALFLYEGVVCVEARCFNISIEGFLELEFSGVECVLECGSAFGEFGIECCPEFIGAGRDFRVEVAAVLVDTFLDEFVELLVECILAGLIG
jgi:hypothetical protein